MCCMAEKSGLSSIILAALSHESLNGNDTITVLDGRSGSSHRMLLGFFHLVVFSWPRSDSSCANGVSTFPVQSENGSSFLLGVTPASLLMEIRDHCGVAAWRV
ncbi:hypothetical protein BV898_04301 [Hypsibius exemplaris]|uniref:Uncharacterized protein n=1 Tax=Hypsibius exemplaris TaxID=2072580 RepID=A0A1W0X2K5_HYPEX|nr:hypothetical protein BV898_04301 [Hypsibius exemplaris]